MSLCVCVCVFVCVCVCVCVSVCVCLSAPAADGDGFVTVSFFLPVRSPSLFPAVVRCGTVGIVFPADSGRVRVVQRFFIMSLWDSI